jgi:hypothetical protein
MTPANLSRHLAVGPTVWLARPGGVHWYCGGHWLTARLPNRRDVLAVDAVRTWFGSHPGGWRYLYGMVALGHAVMRLIDGSAREDELARTRMEAGPQLAHMNDGQA